MKDILFTVGDIVLIAIFIAAYILLNKKTKNEIKSKTNR